MFFCHTKLICRKQFGGLSAWIPLSQYCDVSTVTQQNLSLMYQLVLIKIHLVSIRTIRGNNEWYKLDSKWSIFGLKARYNSQVTKEFKFLVVWKGKGHGNQLRSHHKLVFLSFYAFSTWKMAFSKLAWASRGELLTCQKRTKSKGSRDHNHIHSHQYTTKPLPFLAGQPNPSFLNKKDLHQTAQVGVKQGTLLPKLLILCILQRLPSR